MSEEFSISPAEAGEQDAAECKDIMALRRYRDSWQKIHEGVKQADLPDTPSMRKALEVQIQRVKEERGGG